MLASSTLTPASAYPARYLTARGYSGGGTCRIRFVGGTWTGGGGGVIYVPSGVACEAWADGLLGQSEHWDVGQPYSVRFAEDNAEFFEYVQKIQANRAGLDEITQRLVTSVLGDRELAKTFNGSQAKAGDKRLFSAMVTHPH